MKYTIFSIDGVTEVHALAKFMRHIDTQRVMGKMEGEMVQLIGSYKGALELSFILLTEDFEKHVKPYGFVSNQESVLLVSECNKQYADLLYLQDGHREALGSLKDVSKDEAMKHDGWSYRPDLGTYWITVKGNPDRVHNG